MTARQMLFASAAGGLHSGSITVADGNPYYGYDTGSLGSYTTYSGATVTALYYTSGNDTLLVISSAFPGEPSSVTVNVGATSAAFTKSTSTSYTASGDALGLQAKAGFAYSVSIA